MSENMKKMDEMELNQINGGAEGKVGLYEGPFVTVHGLTRGYLALRSTPSYDPANEIGQLYNGDTVQVMGNDAMVDHDFDGPGETFYTWVYSAKLNKSGWVNSRFIK